MKKLLCVFISLVLVLSSNLFAVYADDEFETDEFAYYDKFGNLCDVYEENDLANEIEFTCCEAIAEPQPSNVGAYNVRENGISTYNIRDTSESTDINVNIQGLTSSQLLNNTSNDDLKILNIVEQLKLVVQQKYNTPTAYPILQGSGSDGNYIYYVVTVVKKKINSNVNIELGCGVIRLQFNIDGDLELLDYKFDSDYNDLELIGHGNDIAYNSIKDTLVFARGGLNDNSVAIIDADFFRGKTNALSVETKTTGCRLSTIDFNDTLNRYIVNVTGNHNMYCMLDYDFNLIGVVNTIGNEKAYHQGSYCDNNYVYSVYKIKNSELLGDRINYQNVLTIHNWKGEKIKEINFEIVRNTIGSEIIDYEIEGITMIGDKIIIGFNVIYTDSNNQKQVKFYYHDLSSNMFNVKYCPDTNVGNYINDTSLDSTNIFYGILTSVKQNKFIRNGYEFKGWNVYNIANNKWQYYNSSEQKYYWYEDGQAPSSCTKRLCKDKISISKTVPAGGHILLCAVWQATNKFTVSFNSNNGSGKMNDITVVYGTAKTVPNNSFTKINRGETIGDNNHDDETVNSTFMGWNVYNVEKEQWLYTKSDGTRAWYKEGTQPTGSNKTAYSNGTTISQTAKAGQHIIFYALWNEYIICYNSGKKPIKANKILAPTCVTYNSYKTVKKYSTAQIEDSVRDQQNDNIFDDYIQHRVEDGTTKYKKISDGSVVWLPTNQQQNSNIYIYDKFTGTRSSKTTTYGKKVVFEATWKA